VKRATSEAQVATELLRWTLELKLDAFLFDLERRYIPDQPRVPAGNADGGQWTNSEGLAGRTPLWSGLRAGGRKPVRVALGAVLIGKRFGFGDDRVIVHCYYRDMLGRDFTIERDATLLCPPTRPADSTG
jgi:hypothetical protein